MDFLRTYTDQIEQVSVDECYLDFTGIADRFSSPVAAAFEIKDEVLRRFGFTVNVGISTNKLLAKMASDFEKPNKVHTLFPEEIREKMWPLPIRELYMAGFQCPYPGEAGGAHHRGSGPHGSGHRGIAS